MAESATKSPFPCVNSRFPGDKNRVNSLTSRVPLAADSAWRITPWVHLVGGHSIA